MAPPVPAPSNVDLALFLGGFHNGNLGGRAGVDALCDRARPPGVVWGRGFISVNHGDELRYVVPPSLYATPIRAISGALLAPNWAGLLDGDLDGDILTVVGAARWWSGSDRGGRWVPSSCQGWTSASDLQGGAYGCAGTTAAQWLCCDDGPACGLGGDGTGEACAQMLPFACVGPMARTEHPAWCPATSTYYAEAPPTGGRALRTFGRSGGGLGPTGGTSWVQAAQSAAGICNAQDGARPLSVEVRGVDCLSCPARFAHVAAGECVAAPFSGMRTGVVEYCVAEEL